MSQQRITVTCIVHVIEARNLVGKDDNKLSDPFVRVSVCGRRQQTDIKRNTVSATWDQVFTFDAIRLSYEDYEREHIHVQVFDANVFHRNELIGQFSFSLPKVRNQPPPEKHQYYRQWVALTDPTMPQDEQGYLLLSVTVLGPGDSPPSHLTDQHADVATVGGTLESRVLRAPNSGRRRGYHFTVKVMHAEQLPATDFWGETCDPFVVVRFNGVVMKTPIERKTISPSWNYQLQLPVYTPLFSDTVELQLWDYRRAQPDELIGAFRMQFSSLLSDSYPPTWFNIYGQDPADGTGVARWICDLIRRGELEATCYLGRVLVSLTTTIASGPFMDERACVPIKGPPPERYTLRIDLYEGSELPVGFGGDAMVEVAFGPPGNTVRSKWCSVDRSEAKSSDPDVKIAPRVRFTCDARNSAPDDFDSGSGQCRFKEIEVLLPRMRKHDPKRVTNQLYDVIVSVYVRNALGVGGRTKVGYIRIKTIDAWGHNPNPEWHPIKGLVRRTGFSKTPGFLLMYETLEVSGIETAKELALAPDIEIRVNDSDALGSDYLGRAFFPPKLAEPQLWSARPRWLRLNKNDHTSAKTGSSRAAVAVSALATVPAFRKKRGGRGDEGDFVPEGDYKAGDILIKLEVLKDSELDDYAPWWEHPWPEVRPCQLHLATVGLRNLQNYGVIFGSIENPYVRVSVTGIPDMRQLLADFAEHAKHHEDADAGAGGSRRRKGGRYSRLKGIMPVYMAGRYASLKAKRIEQTKLADDGGGNAAGVSGGVAAAAAVGGGAEGAGGSSERLKRGGLSSYFGGGGESSVMGRFYDDHEADDGAYDDNIAQWSNEPVDQGGFFGSGGSNDDSGSAAVRPSEASIEAFRHRLTFFDKGKISVSMPTNAFYAPSVTIRVYDKGRLFADRVVGSVEMSSLDFADEFYRGDLRLDSNYREAVTRQSQVYVLPRFAMTTDAMDQMKALAAVENEAAYSSHAEKEEAAAAASGADGWGGAGMLYDDGDEDEEITALEQRRMEDLGEGHWALESFIVVDDDPDDLNVQFDKDGEVTEETKLKELQEGVAIGIDDPDDMTTVTWPEARTNKTHAEQRQGKLVLEGLEDSNEFGTVPFSHIKLYRGAVYSGGLMGSVSKPKEVGTLKAAIKICSLKDADFVGGTVAGGGSTSDVFSELNTEPTSLCDTIAKASVVRPITSVLSSPQSVKLRVYVVAASDLTPKDTVANIELVGTSIMNRNSSDPYLVLKTEVPPDVAGVSVDDGRYFSGVSNMNDRMNYKPKTLSPFFGKHFELDVRFPDVSLLTIQVWDANVINDDLIGSTTIDLEDRWFNPEWQRRRLAEGTFLREFRPLWHPSSTLPQGNIELWVEMHQEREFIKAPIQDIRRPAPEPFELRVVVWETRRVPALEEHSYIDMYVTGELEYQLTGEHDGEWAAPQWQSTDVHYGVRSGTGLYNWRMVYNIEAPCRYPRLKMMIWNQDFLSANDAMGEAIIDIGPLLNQARNAPDKTLERSRTWIRTVHANWPGQGRGEIDMQLKIVPLRVAENNPVGLGRDAPNRDPFLAEPERESFWGNFFKSLGVWKICCCLILLAIPIIAIVIFMM